MSPTSWPVVPETSIVQRIRTLKPEHRAHRKVGKLSDRAYRIWVAMILEADDQGRLVADPDQLLSAAFPYQRSLTVQETEAALEELTAPGLVVLYTVQNTRYAWFPSWGDHQRIDKPKPSKLPKFPSDSVRERSRLRRGAVVDESRRIHVGSGSGSGSGSDRIGSGSDQNLLHPSAAHAASVNGSDSFAEFWSLYPRHKAKAEARKAWSSALKSTSSSVILDGLRRLEPDLRVQYGRGFCPYPATWLRAGQWSDEADPAQQLTPKTSGNLDAAKRFLEGPA